MGGRASSLWENAKTEVERQDLLKVATQGLGPLVASALLLAVAGEDESKCCACKDPDGDRQAGHRDPCMGTSVEARPVRRTLAPAEDREGRADQHRARRRR